MLCLPTFAFAQVQNGDFENGGAGWVVDPPPPGWTVDFPPAGGNPNGRAAITSPFGNSQGEACIRQSFQCSSPGAGDSCNISFDYRLESIDAAPFSGRVRVLVDGVEMYVSAPTDFPGIPWTSVSITVPCGQHEIALCLQVDIENNGWQASFDNVRAECRGTVPTRPRTWGDVKLIYR